MESAKDDGRGYDELAPRSDIFAGNLSLGVPDLIKDAFASRQVVVPRVGKSNPSRRSIQQPCAEMRFQLCQLSTDGGKRQTQRTRSRGEASLVHHGYEDRHRFQTIQLTISASKTMSFKITALSFSVEGSTFVLSRSNRLVTSNQRRRSLCPALPFLPATMSPRRPSRSWTPSTSSSASSPTCFA